MTDEEFLPKLREAFAIEAREHLQAMTSGLLELEKARESPRQKGLTEIIFREIHSLKGAAGAVNRTDLQTVCQALEDVFSSWKKQPVHVAPESFDTLSRAVDLVGRLIRLSEVVKDAAELEAITGMSRQLGELLGAPSAAAVPASPPPAPEPVPAGTRGATKAAAPTPAGAVPPQPHPAPD